ncbi:hypothetical protein DI09_10p440 [Mitosporidium daphniae]|uniref:BHLH domain-containing protein n=1 Tax=Mitosporidium daphniae TaxID=1485682 RepID=A0A098VW20_9MICR|nr:uncharacterized protein DI09_10p440 [Mitosporidium daphniae]KGG53147.1 hypothetical protein DI09_10p440 [Mitosporidium daphniae]|eukprot:XP_013239574.1 uncharacterized protein DI09_10p440 [Mitosporidium daphniae]
MCPTSTPPLSGESNAACSDKRPILTQEQRRLHHIRSEQRRRFLLREELYKLYGLIPNSSGSSIDAILSQAKHGGPLNLSEATIIKKGLC